MNISLRMRMLCLAVVPAALVTILLSMVFVLYSLENLERELRTRGKAISRQASAAAEYGIFSGQRDSLMALTESTLRIDPDVRGAAVVDPGGAIIAHSGDLHPFLWSGLAKSEGRRMGQDLLLFVEPVMRTSLPVDDIYAGEKVLGAAESKVIGHVMVELTLGEVSRKSWYLIATATLAGLLALALGAWVAIRIAQTVTQPLLEAGEVVARIGAGDSTARMTAGPTSALQSLELGINAMAERIGLTQADLHAQVAEATLGLQREKDAAEHATLAKSHFLAAASHDLRQPLHALGLFVSGLAQKVAKQEPKLVANIRASVDALQNMLDTILDMSRLDHGNLIPKIGDFPMASVLDRLAHKLSPLAEQKRLQLKVRRTQIWAHSDPDIVERILLNLVGNALRYTHAGGVLVSCRRRRDVLRVEVWDTGEGIPEHEREKIFEDYVQLGNPERDRAKGLGLGLAICRRLAALLAMPMGVSSRLGRGSVFWIELPVVEPKPGEHNKQQTDGVIPQIEDAAELARLSGTVLVVEGDPMIRTSMEQAIVSWGSNVVLAATREEALHCCRESDHVPDLMVCNIRLPDRDSGLELAEELQREFKHMSILLVSADTSEEVQAAASRANFALLRKPISPSRLRAALRQLLPAPR
jgi:signal transduction histidine kinase